MLPQECNVTDVVFNNMRCRAVQQYGLRSHLKRVFVAWSHCVDHEGSQTKRERLDILIVPAKKRAQL
jgi:hypothetical protein